MNPINSDYIHFIESQITVALKPWYKKVHKWEADSKVEVWRKAWVMSGNDMKDLGLDVPDEHICSFYNIGEDPVLQAYIIKHGNPAGNVVLETYISSKE